MKLENTERVQDLFNELRILKGYVMVKDLWKAENRLQCTLTKVQFSDTVQQTSLYSPRDNSITDSRLRDAIDNVETVFMECVRGRIKEIETELEKL